MTLATFRESRWFRLVWIIPALLVAGAIFVGIAVWLRTLPGVQEFLTKYSGHSELPVGTPEGFPAWLNWQHFFNSFFILFVITSGWKIRNTKRPAAYWTRNNTGVLKTKGEPQRISIIQWFHISMNTLWLLNGVLLYVLLFVSGQWARIIPTDWDIFPNALSAALQYASLNWPHEMGWVNYNALQVLAYFVTVFIAAPLAVLTGLRMTPGLAERWKPLERVFPVQLARLLHFPIMIYFVAFIFVHVLLVLTTWALNNLNHMYAANNGESWWGFGLFMGSLVLIAVAWVAFKPSILAMIAGLTGKVRR